MATVITVTVPQVSENDAAEQIQYSPGQQESGEKNSIQQSQKKMKKGFNCLKNHTTTNY